MREREQATAVYLERVVPVTLESGERVNALTYVGDRLHEQYAGRLEREAMLGIVRAAHGQSGQNAEYVIETHDHLAAIGVRDRDLEGLPRGCAPRPRTILTESRVGAAPIANRSPEAFANLEKTEIPLGNGGTAHAASADEFGLAMLDISEVENSGVVASGESAHRGTRAFRCWC